MTNNDDLEARRRKNGEFGNKENRDADDVVNAPEVNATPSVDAFNTARTAAWEAEKAVMVVGQKALAEVMAANIPVIDYAEFNYYSGDLAGSLILQGVFDADGQQLHLDDDTRNIIDTIGGEFHHYGWIDQESEFRYDEETDKFIFENPAVNPIDRHIHRVAGEAGWELAFPAALEFVRGRGEVTDERYLAIDASEADRLAERHVENILTALSSVLGDDEGDDPDISDERWDEITDHLNRVAKEADLESMGPLLVSVQQREEVSDDAFLTLGTQDVVDLYDWWVGPQIDRLEADLLGRN